MIRSSSAVANAAAESLRSVTDGLILEGCTQASDTDVPVESARTNTYVQLSDIMNSLSQSVGNVAGMIESIAANFVAADMASASAILGN